MSLVCLSLPLWGGLQYEAEMNVSPVFKSSKDYSKGQAKEVTNLVGFFDSYHPPMMAVEGELGISSSPNLKCTSPPKKNEHLNLHNQPVEKEHVLPNLYDFGFHILMFQGVINLLVVCKCLATTKSSIEVSEKHESARTFKEKLLANLMMVKNPSIRPPIS